VPVLQNAASDIVQIKSRQALAPLLEIVLARSTYDLLNLLLPKYLLRSPCSYLFRRLFDVATAAMQGGAAGPKGAVADASSS
jgi:hypothetical protein